MRDRTELKTRLKKWVFFQAYDPVQANPGSSREENKTKQGLAVS